VGDAFHRFVDHERLMVGDEGAAHEAGKVFGMSAEPQPEDQQNRQQDDEHGCQWMAQRLWHGLGQG
jgi:hypothetical protein